MDLIEWRFANYRARLITGIQQELRVLDGQLAKAHADRMANPAHHAEYDRLRAYQQGLMFACNVIHDTPAPGGDNEH